MFFASNFKKFKNIKHCFFSRKNGVSQGYYESLNCGSGSDDNKENVLKNLELVAQNIGCDKDRLITLNQTQYFARKTLNMNTLCLLKQLGIFSFLTLFQIDNQN